MLRSSCSACGPRLQGVLVDPADAGGVGSQLDLGRRRQRPLDAGEVLQHAAAGPVQVGAVLEDDVDEREAEERVAAHGLGEGHGEHLGRQRVGDLVLDDLRRLARVGGEDDHLDVGEVGNRVERDVEHGPDAAGGHGARSMRMTSILLRTLAVDDPLDHGSPSVRVVGWPAVPRRRNLAIASWTRLSESSMNWAWVTTASPAATPVRTWTTVALALDAQRRPRAGSNRPSPRSTKTMFRSPERITADCGIDDRVAAPAGRASRRRRTCPAAGGRSGWAPRRRSSACASRG